MLFYPSILLQKRAMGRKKRRERYETAKSISLCELLCPFVHDVLKAEREQSLESIDRINQRIGYLHEVGKLSCAMSGVAMHVFLTKRKHFYAIVLDFYVQKRLRGPIVNMFETHVLLLGKKKEVSAMMV